MTDQPVKAKRGRVAKVWEKERLTPKDVIDTRQVLVISSRYGDEVWHIVSRRGMQKCYVTGEYITERYHYSPKVKTRPEPNHQGRGRRISVDGMYKLFGFCTYTLATQKEMLRDQRAKFVRFQTGGGYATLYQGMIDPDSVPLDVMLKACRMPPYYCTLENTKAAR